MSHDVVSEYLELMDRQRRGVFAALEGAPHHALWQRPAPREWSIGEILDHTRVVNAFSLWPFRIFWALLRPVAALRRHKAYEVEVENVYERPGFPMNVGWLWPPKHTPQHPVSLEVLREELTETHGRIRAFYEAGQPDLLGHVVLWDPVIGALNLIQWLRVGLYHDELHYRDAARWRGELQDEA